MLHLASPLVAQKCTCIILRLLGIKNKVTFGLKAKILKKWLANHANLKDDAYKTHVLLYG
jgi:hypothetical protein